MITSKELGYVFGNVDRIPYPGINYAMDATDKLIGAFYDYKKFYLDKQYDIILSSGEQLTFEILKANLCHMLGIKYKDLISQRYDNFRMDILGQDPTESISSYNLLESIVEHIDDVVDYDLSVKGEILNYYRLMVKGSIFEKLSDFSRFDFGIINFDRDYYNSVSSIATSIKSDKLLYVQSNEAISPYFMMGILPNNPSQQLKKTYVVETLFAPENTKDFFSCQEVCIPTQILVNANDNLDKIEATPNEKIALLNQYRAIIEGYDIPNRLNIYGDYKSVLVEQTTQTKVRRREQDNK